jgi:hypothetical protein
VPALRPRVRIPLWAAATIGAPAFVVRSALRGWDFRPDLPIDVIVGAAFILVVALRLWTARSLAAHERDREGRQQVRREDAAAHEQGPPSELG